jgi:hypothetical protein
MTPDLELEQELERLGQLLASETSIVDRVMQRIDEFPQRPARSVVSRRWLLYSAAALAASVTLLLSWHFVFSRHSITEPIATIAQDPIPPAAGHVVDEVRWSTATEKAVNLPNDMPVREVVHQEFVRVQWYDDQQQATMQVTIHKQPAVRMTMAVY